MNQEERNKYKENFIANLSDKLSKGQKNRRTRKAMKIYDWKKKKETRPKESKQKPKE